MIRFAHTADSHNGLNRFRKTNHRGYNDRGEDYLESFRSAYASMTSFYPDFIIIAGDLFENITVDIRYVYEVQKILSKSNTPTYIIAGNHDAPKTKSLINPIYLLDVVPNVVIFDKKTELCLEEKSLKIHFIPWIPDYEEFQKNLLEATPDKSYTYNIAVTHGGIPMQEYKYSKDLIPLEFLKKDFDYIALGDYHSYKQVEQRAFYPGSTDVFRKSEIGEKFWLNVSIGEEFSVEKNAIKNRPCHNYKIDCKGLSLEKIFQEIKDKNKKDTLVYLDLLNVDPFLRDTLKNSDIKKILYDVFYVDIVKTFFEEAGKQGSNSTENVKGIIQEWNGFEKDESVRKFGMEYLSKSVEESANED